MAFKKRTCIRRWLKRIVVCLFLGAVVNVAVAWGLAYFIGCSRPMYDLYLSRGSDHYFHGSSDRYHAGWEYAPWVEQIVARRVEKRTAKIAPLTVEMVLLDLNDPQWQALEMSTNGLATSEVHAFGWPMLSMCQHRIFLGPFLSQHIHDSPCEREIHNRFSLKVASVDTGWHPLWYPDKRLPLRPIPNAFVINTFVYALLAYVLLFAFVDVRRLLRRIHGKCVHCAYQLLNEQAVCSECGRGR